MKIHRNYLLWLALIFVMSGVLVSASLHPIQAQDATNRATSTLIPPSPTPAGTPAATFVPARPQVGQPIAIGDTIEGQLRAGRWDIWQFEASAEQHVTITLRSSDFDPLLELYSPTDSRIPLYSDDDGGRGRNATLRNVSLSSDGTYLIYARSYNNEGTGMYRLSLEANVGAIPTTATSSPIAYDTTLNATLETEQATYYFEASSGDEVAIMLSSNDFDTYLELVDSEGTPLAENDDNGRGQNSAIIDFELPANGLYFIIVASYALDVQGAYELELLKTGPNIDGAGGAIRPGETVTARLFPSHVAEWHFTGKANDIISVSAMPVDPNEALDMILEVFTPDNTTISDDDGGYERNPALTDFRLPLSGEYTIRVREYTPTIGGFYHLALANGRTYFSPEGQAARFVPLDTDESTTLIDSLNDSDHQHSLWITSAPEGELLTVSLVAGNGGSGILQDFTIRIMDTTWETVAESASGEVSTDNVISTTDFLILIRYQGPGEQPYQLQLLTTFIVPSLAIDAPIIGTLELDAPVTHTLTLGQRHAWQFTAPEAGSYSFSLSKIDDTQTYDPYLYVLDERGEQLAQNDDGGGGVNPRITLDLEAEQSIVVLAASFGDLSGGDYTLIVTLAP